MTARSTRQETRAALGKDTPEAQVLARQLKDHLWAGRVDEVIVTLQRHADRLVRLKPLTARNIRAGCRRTTWVTSRLIDVTWTTRGIDGKVGRSARASRNQPSSCSTSG